MCCHGKLSGRWSLRPLPKFWVLRILCLYLLAKPWCSQLQERTFLVNEILPVSWAPAKLRSKYTLGQSRTLLCAGFLPTSSWVNKNPKVIHIWPWYRDISHKCTYTHPCLSHMLTPAMCLLPRLYWPESVSGLTGIPVGRDGGRKARVSLLTVNHKAGRFPRLSPQDHTAFNLPKWTP